jgi:hypothetical protein
VRQDARAGAGRGAAMHAVLRHVNMNNALKAVGLCRQRPLCRF